MSATLVDLSEARLQRAVEAMDDETLIWTMLGLQSPTEWGAPMFGGQTEQGVTLQRRYVSIPVPEHVDPDGTIKEANNQVVEVVQIWKAVPTRQGGTLFLCK